jgi:alkylated DNA nucleotide flippase Atl1
MLSGHPNIIRHLVLVLEEEREITVGSLLFWARVMRSDGSIEDVLSYRLEPLEGQ